jgi:predicted ATPase
VVGNGDAILILASQFLALAQKYDMTFPIVLGHRMMGTSLAHTGDLRQGRAHLDRAIALYDPASHRALATRFVQDVRMASLSRRSLALWSLGYPEAALADANSVINDARQIDHVATYFMALFFGSLAHVFCGSYATAAALIDEGVALAEKKALWLSIALIWRGLLFAAMDKSSEAVQPLMSGLSLYRTAGTKLHLPFFLPYLAMAHAKLGKLDDAWRCIDEATTLIETTKERWCEAEVYRVAGEVALLQRDTAKANEHFERALTIARQQQAKSWELRAAMSRARLWRDQGKRDEARDLLAPVYGWFTEGFDTLDLKEAKKLLDTLA